MRAMEGFSIDRRFAVRRRRVMQAVPQAKSEAGGRPTLRPKPCTLNPYLPGQVGNHGG